MFQMANLMNYIKHGDECTVLISTQNEGSGPPIPIVKGAWVGPKTEIPIKLQNNKDLAKWLVSRGVPNEAAFKQWIQGKSKDKEYFPFISEVYEATVLSINRDNDGKGETEICIVKYA